MSLTQPRVIGFAHSGSLLIEGNHLVQPTCQIAFKEWAAVCEALAAGRQTIVLRKGGIHEGRDGFRVQHREFWLYPTNFHQGAERLTSDAGEFMARASAATKTGPSELPLVPIRLFAEVAEVRELSTEDAALCLAGWHIWSETTVRQRFAYRQPGLFLLAVRIFARTEPEFVAESPAMAGCKSWVELPQAISTDGLEPVLNDAEFAAALAQIRAAVA
jgi:hypothetical protein